MFLLSLRCHKFQLVGPSATTSADFFPQIKCSVEGSKNFRDLEKVSIESIKTFTFPGRTNYISGIEVFERRHLGSMISD